MIHRAALLFLLVFTLISFGGCVAGQYQIIDVSTLSAEEGEKVKAIRLVEAEELDKASYKSIKKVKGLSCEVWTLSWTQRLKQVSRKEAVEQLKIRAVRAEGNAISNIVCVFESNMMVRNARCLKWVTCSADAIQVE